MHGRRSNYTILSQIPDDQQHPPPPAGRLVALPLQRQSSGSSFGESSMSGEYYAPSYPAVDPNAFGYANDDVYRLRGAAEWSSSKSWALQTEESYQLQLALALRLSSEATCADDPNFLDPVPDELALRSPAAAGAPEAMSHRFWNLPLFRLAALLVYTLKYYSMPIACNNKEANLRKFGVAHVPRSV